MLKGLKINHFISYGGLLIVGLFAFLLIKSPPTEAATGVNQTINFQGRLLNNQGATVPDGFYNIQFKIYQDGDGQTAGDTTGSPSGSLKWTESHLNNNTQGVKVVNGYLSVNLGSVTAFGTSINWNQDTLWLSMNVGSTNATCTPFSSCSPDGEMVPMQPMTSAPYSLNSGMLGGLTSSQFVQLAQGVQTDASNAVSIGINKTGSGDIINLQSNSVSIFSVNTTGNTLNLGAVGTTSANSTIHIADSSAGIQTVTIGSTNSSSATTIQAGSGGLTVNANTTISGSKTFATGSGNVSLNGDTTVASGKNFTQSGGGTFSTGAGTNTLNGDTTIASGKTFTANGTALFKTNSATAFQVQNTSTTNFFVVDTNSNIVNIGVTGAVNANSTIHIADSSAGIQAVTLGSTNSSSATTIQAGSGGLTVNANTTISGSNTFTTGTGAVALNGDTTVASGKNFTQSGGGTFDTGSGANHLNGDTTIAGSHTFATGTGTVALNGDTTVANDKSFTANGAATFSDHTNSGTAFQIQKSIGSDTLFTADTSLNKIVIGNATGTDANTTLLVLDSASGTDPATGYNGAQYYNTTLNKFRCYQNGTWTDCITSAIGSVGTYSSSNHYADGATISGSALILGSADATHPGLIDTSSQTFTGDKIFKAATFTVQSTGAQSLFIADTAGSKVAIGPAAVAANSVLTIGTNTTAASGGITFGTDTSATLYRSAAAELTTGATLNVAALQSSGDISFTSTSATAGAITKTFITDTNGVNQFDVVIMSTVPDIETTTTARDNMVFGVSQSTIASGGTGFAKVVTSGNYRVNVDLGAVAIGNQLVTSTTPGRATVDNNATTGIIGTALSAKGAGANGTVNVYVKPVNGQYTPTFRAAGTSPTAFQVQNSGGNNFLAIDTNSNIVNLGITGSTNISSTIHIGDSSAGIQTVVVGSTNSSSTTTIQSGTNGISLDGNTTIAGSHSFATGTGTVGLNGDTTVASGKNFTQSGGGNFSTGSGTVGLNGNTTVATGKTFTVTDSATTLGGNLDVTGSAAFKKGTDFSTAGTTNDAVFANASLIRLSSASAQTITGIQNGRDGYILTIVNAGTLPATLTNEDTNSTNINRITTGTGNSISLPVGASITLVYDANGQRWRASLNANLQTAYNSSTSPQITLDSTHGGLVVQDASSAIGADLFTVQANGASTKYLNVTSAGVTVNGTLTQNGTLAVTGNITATGTYNTNTFSSTALQFGGTSGSISSGTGNLDVKANGTSTLTLDTTGAGTVGIATGNATTVNIATNATAHNIHIGDAGAGTTQTITIGSNGVAADSVTINAGNNVGAGITLGANTVVSGSNTFTTGTGAVALNGDTTVASGKNFTQSGGGTFDTGSGANHLNGDTTIAGSHTFDTGTGNVNLNGNTAIASGKTFTANGTALFKTNSATAFQVQNTNNRSILAIDTTTNILTVGNSTDGSIIALGATGNVSSAITKNMAVTGAVSANDLVQVDTANDGKVKQAVANSSLIFGIATAAASSSNVDVAISGVYQVNADATALVPGDLLVSSSTAGKVTKAGSTVASGTVLGRALSTKGSGTGLVWVTLTLGVGGSDSLQTAYNNSVGGTTPEIKVDSPTHGGLDIQDADSTIGGSLLTVRGSNNSNLGAALFDVQSTGATFIGSTTQTATITLGQSTDSNTINIGNAATASGKTQAINIGTGGASGSITNISIGSTVAGTTTINGATAVNITGNTTVTGSNTFATGSGAVSLNGDTTIASGKNFTQSGGGTFSTGSGINTLNGDTTIAGSHTFATGTGTVALNGDTTIASGKTFTDNGTALFKTASPTAFQFQNSSSRNILNIDTNGNILGVGNNTDGANLTLNATGNANGAIRKSMVVTGTIAANDLVEIDTSNAGQVQQAVASSTRVFGIATSAVGSGSAQDIVISGVYQVNANTSGGTPAIGDVLVSSTTAGQVTKTGTTTASGSVVGLALSTISAGKIWVYMNLGLGGADNLQTVYGKSTGGTTPEILLDNTRNGLDIQDNSLAAGTTLLAVRGTATSSTLGTGLFTVNNKGEALHQTTTNSATAFQIQNSNGAQLFNVDTTNPVTDGTSNAPLNHITNGSFENNSVTGWVKMGTSQVAVVADNTQQYIGNYSQKIVTNATDTSGTDGTKYALATSTLQSNTKYYMSLYAKTLPGASMSTFEMGYSRDGTTGNQVSCLTAQTVTGTGWTQYTCTFTVNGTSSGTPYIYIRQTDQVARTFFIDGVLLTRYSLLANASVEQAITSGDWQLKGSATVTRDTTQFQDGAASLKIVTSSGASNNDGAKNNITLNDSYNYTLNFYAKLDSGSTALSTMEAGYSSDGSTDNTVCITGQTVVSTGWTQYSCNFQTPASHTGTPYLYIKELNTTGPKTFYVDAVSLTAVNSVTAYQEGRIALNGVINSPVVFQNQQNSTTAFQLQNASGSNVMVVDSVNKQLKIYENNGSTNYALIYYDSASSTANFSANTGTVALGSGAGSISLVSGSGGGITITSNATSLWRTTAGTLTLQSGTSSDLILTSGSSIINVSGSSVVKLGSSSGDPGTCTAGAVVYNNSTNKLRGCEGGTLAWADLVQSNTTLQQAYAASTGGTTAEIKLDTTRAALDVQGDNAGTVTDIFNVHAGTASGLGQSLFDVDRSGNITMNTSAGITTIQTSGTDVSIGQGNGAHSSNPIILVLDNYQPVTAGSEPGEQDGAMYYDADDNMFKCGLSGYWQDCAVNNIQSSFNFTDDFLSGGTATGGIGDLGWAFPGAGTCGTPAYNPTGGPTISHDHPGVLDELSTATTTTTCIMQQSTNIASLGAAGDALKFTLAEGATTNSVMRVGLTNQASTTPTTRPLVGVWWEADNSTNTHWQYCYGTGAAAVCNNDTNGTPTITANAWNQFEIHIVSSTAIDFVYNGNVVSLTGLTLSLGTAGGTRVTPTIACGTRTTTAMHCYTDYYQWTGAITTTGGR
jgi:hypothetical protein